MSEKLNVRQRVRQIVDQELGLRLGEREANRGDDGDFGENFGADSLNEVELIMEFEDVFDIQIPDSDTEKITTINEAVAYIEKKRR
ncbi:acyl carrier protein [Oligoflexia bacterium]|nr:acyl carrier protein [Oligoflexia bacterium]